jgi:hypothetical protein
MLDYHHYNEKIWKNSRNKKKVPSLIFDIFRDGKVSFDIKTIICIVPKTFINFFLHLVILYIFK